MKEELEKLKNDLEEMKLYSKSDMIAVFNRETDKYEILIPKRGEKIHQNSTNSIYINLKREQVKIIYKKNFIAIKPNKYSYKFFMSLKDNPLLEKKFYSLEELEKIEELLNSHLHDAKFKR